MSKPIIKSKKILFDGNGAPRLVRMGVYVPRVAQKAQPGQFVIVMVSDVGERVPLTVVDTDADQGTVDIIFQEAGMSTKLLGKKEVGDSIEAFLGPLGHPTDVKKYGTVCLVAGGVGIAEMYPVAKALKEAGNDVSMIIGSRTKDLLFLESELKAVVDRLLVATDDGSKGTHGFVTDVLTERLKEAQFDKVFTVGPVPMMQAVAAVTKPHKIPTMASLNTLMVDGTGMCGSCRVTVGGEVKFACVDGPEFDAQLVDWDEIKNRNAAYGEQEGHVCRLEGVS